jgi:hypothetical protein
VGAAAGRVLDMPGVSARSAEEVIGDHLSQSRHGSIDEDLRRNYSESVVLLTGHGTFRGHDGLRQLNDRLNRELPGARFDYRTLLVEGEVGFVEWTARTVDARVTDGADSYVVRGGRIAAQTIHYTVRRREDRAAVP